jgi:cell division protease FtsH
VNNNWIQKVGVWLVVGLILFTVFKQFDKPRAQEGITYSQFMDDAKTAKSKELMFRGAIFK